MKQTVDYNALIVLTIEELQMFQLIKFVQSVYRPLVYYGALYLKKKLVNFAALNCGMWVFGNYGDLTEFCKENNKNQVCKQ